MTDNVVLLGAFVGVIASAGFIWLEVGRYAEPQVPRTLFDERRIFWAYTAGLFVGIPLAILYTGIEAFLLVGAAGGEYLLLGLMIGVLELGQWVVVRTLFFGTGGDVPFYVLGYRAGAAGLLGIVVVGYDFPSTLDLGALAAIGVRIVLTVAFVLMFAAAGIQSTPTGPRSDRRPGSVGRGVILEIVGFLLLVFGLQGGLAFALAAALVVSGGSAGLYLRRRDPVIATVRPLVAGEGEEAGAPPGRYARRDRKGSG